MKRIRSLRKLAKFVIRTAKHQLAVEKGGQRGSVAEEVAVGVLSGFVFPCDLGLGNAQKVIKAKLTVLLFPEFTTILGDVQSLKVARKGGGENALAGRLATEQADAPDEICIYERREPLAVPMDIGPQETARNGELGPQRVYADMVHDGMAGLTFAEERGEFMGKPVAILLAGEYGIDRDAEHIAAEAPDETTMSEFISVIVRNADVVITVRQHQVVRIREQRGEPSAAFFRFAPQELGIGIADDGGLVTRLNHAANGVFVAAMQRAEFSDYQAAMKILAHRGIRRRQCRSETTALIQNAA